MTSTIGISNPDIGVQLPAGAPPPLPIAPRFWPRVAQTEAGCWLWTGEIEQDGYGKFWLTRRKALRAHRLAWALTHGPIPAGAYVLHSCDTPACVRPNHLRLGTQRENIREAIERGRHKHPAGTHGPMVQTVLRHA